MGELWRTEMPPAIGTSKCHRRRGAIGDPDGRPSGHFQAASEHPHVDARRPRPDLAPVF
jgi:hypothetical protein